MQWHIDTQAQRQACSYTYCTWGCTHVHTSRVISSTFVINSHSGLMFTAYSLSKPQTCLFLLSQNSKHPLSKDFFFVSLACLFFLHAFRSPTNELNTEETWKRLDEAWLFEQRGDDIVPYDYMHLYQQKQEASWKVCNYSQLCPVGWLHMGFPMCEQLVNDDNCGWQPRTPSLSLFCFSKVSVNLLQRLCLFCCGSSGQVVLVTQTCSRCSMTICLLTGERSREGLDSVTFTQVEQWILQTPLAWVHARWTQ